MTRSAKSIAILAALAMLPAAAAVPLDKFIPEFVVNGQHKGRTLLIIDQVGKQEIWLQDDFAEHGSALLRRRSSRGQPCRPALP